MILLRLDRGARAISQDIWKTSPSAGEQDAKAERLAVLTGAGGAFQFRVEGPVKFKPGTPKSDIVIRLQPESGITGRVVDADTREPLRGLAVMPYQNRNFEGGRILAPAGEAGKTDESGRYRIAGLAPGEYYLEVRPPLAAKLGDPRPVEDFRRDVRRSYGRTWYPGVARVEEAAPVTVVEGAKLGGIDFQIEKRRIAALRGRVTGEENAGRSGAILVSLYKVRRQIGAEGFMTIARGSVKPGAEFEIDRVSPGAYYLMSHTADRTRAERRAAVIVLQVEEENLDGLDLPVRRGLPVTGRVRMDGREEQPDQPALPSEEIAVDLRPLVRMRFEDETPVPVRAKDGTFVVEGVLADRYRVSVAKAPKGYKVSEVRYNGAHCPHGEMAIDPGALAHHLDITLAAASGSVSITATDGIRSAAGATVVLAREPVNQNVGEHMLRWTKTDGDGKAILAELLPGTYRLIAYREGARWMNDPNLKQRLAGGEEVKIGAGSFPSVQVRLQPAP